MFNTLYLSFNNFQTAPKKTAHMLNIILNYLVFYNMQKATIIEKSENVYKMYQTLITERKEVELDNLKAIDCATATEAKTKGHQKMLPHLTSKIQSLNNTKEQFQSEAKDLETQITGLEYTLGQLNNKHECLKGECINDSEVKYLNE